MFSVLPCRHTSILFTVSLNFAGKVSRHSSLSLSSKPCSIFIKSNPRSTIRTMSASRPSAFDVLMSNASKKNKKPQEPSPRKRKAQSQTPNSPLLASSSNHNAAEKQIDSGTNQIGENSSNDGNGSTKFLKKSSVNHQSESNNAGSDNGLVAAKKAKTSIGPDESILELKKKAVEFNVKRAGYWGKGESVPFMFVAKALDAISKESGRIAMTEIVCNLLRTVWETTPIDLLAVVYLLTKKIAGLDLGIGTNSIIKALAEAYGARQEHITKQSKELGDLGLVAKASRSSQPLMCKPEALTVAKVFDTLWLIAKESGKDSQKKKQNHIKALLVAATDCEPQYLIRLLEKDLRVGLADQTLLAALGHASVYCEKHSTHPPKADNSLEKGAKIVKQVYSVFPVYDKIVPALLADGVWNLPKTCRFSPGIPVGPMVAKPKKRVSEILDKFQDIEFTCEYKYDGERAQIHYMENGSVEIYSRSAERNTGKFPDVVADISRLKKPSVTSFVLDCELVAYDREKQKIQSFEILRKRDRKNVVMSEIKINVCIFAFDILYLNGQKLLQEQLNVRREHLYGSFQEEPGFFQFSTAITSNNLEEIQFFFDDAVNSGTEGLIIKTLTKDATYEPSKKSNNWLKLKKDYMESIGDSLDLVPIAAFHGRGKRTGNYGAFLLACYDGDKEEFQSICKIGTGFTETKLEERSVSLRSKIIPGPKSYYRYSDSTVGPDVWFEPSEVWEVKAADLTSSRLYHAAIGIVDPNKGISLRFPRIVRFREDKTPEQATSSDMVAEMFKAQPQSHTPNDNRDESEEE